MTTSLHVTNAGNVEGTLNSFFVERLALIDPPTFLPTYGTVAYWPEAEMSPPCFSFVHLPVMTMQMWQGNAEGDGVNALRQHALMEIDAWVNRDAKINGQEVWVRQLQYMTSMVRKVVASNPTIVIKDYLSDPASASLTQYNIKLGDIDEKDTLPDTNPAIKRRRMLLQYWWVARNLV